jgi:UDP-N-acetylmuramate--alanine ligase
VDYQRFKGVDRRFSIQTNSPKVVIDDYAHHPTEINAVADALEAFYPDQIKLGVFQPHLFSRTLTLQQGLNKPLHALIRCCFWTFILLASCRWKGITSALLIDNDHGATHSW